MSLFPLPEGYFRPLQYTQDELAHWKQRVVQLVRHTLRDERPVLASNYDRVDLHAWKLAKRKDQLRVYRPRHGAMAAAVTSPCVLAVGTIAGTLEDVVYGIHTTTTRDLRVTRPCCSDTTLDAALLHVFENGTDEDPYRSFSLTWRALQTPGGSLVSNRDACVLEYLGMDRDDHGRRYAFHISESIEHAVCPPLTAQGVVRADTHIYTIYRELDNGRVGVYLHATYNMNGHMPKLFASWTATAVAFSVGNSVACAEAKKLTALALHNQHVAESTVPRPPAPCPICTMPSTLQPRTGGRATSKTCRVCHTSVCSKCCSDRYLLTDATKIRVACCKQCIVSARHLRIDPRRPLRLVSSSAWIRRGEIRDSVARAATRTRTMTSRRRSTRYDDSTRSHVSRPELSPSRKLSTPRPLIQLTPRNDTPQIATTGTNVAPQFAASVAPVAPLPPPPPRTPRTPRTPRAPSSSSPPMLWETMLQLRDAAEHTSHLTEEINKLMEATVEPTALHSVRSAARDRGR